MERILVLMKASSWADASQALTLARENALYPKRLTFALLLQREATEQEKTNMADFGPMLYLVTEQATFAEMESLWRGERFIALTHAAMRFGRFWDVRLLHALGACQAEDAQAVLTGFLPAEDDPIGAVCPVAAKALTDGFTLHFGHGLPLKMAAAPMEGLFLHPDFFFARAGFVRVMAQAKTPDFLWAMARGWQVFTLHAPIITLTQDLPLAPLTLHPEDEGMTRLCDEYGVNWLEGTLSPAAKRGLKSDTLDVALRVTPLVKAREQLRRQRNQKSDLTPLCVTVCPAEMDAETKHWLRQLTQMKDVSLLCYAQGNQLREIADFHPNVLEYKTRYALALPEGKTVFSRAAILCAARDRVLSGTHYVYIAPDAVRYPLYSGLALPWKRLCNDKIVMAKVQGQLDMSMVIVPDALLKPLLEETQERLRQQMAQGQAPQSESVLWELVIRDHPDWFTFYALPVEKQLFTKLL